MSSSVNPYRAWPAGYKAWKAASDAVYQSGLDPLLLNLVMTRASQINGCAYCLDMHTRDGIEAGEDPRRFHSLAGWRDATWFDEGERAALALTEEVTRLGDGRAVDDATVAAVVEHLGEETYAKLLLAIVIINGWNRINVTSHLAPAPR